VSPVRVVIADDEPPARAKLRRFVAQEAGFEVVAEAADGAEAVDAIRTARPDLVFLDVQMPGLSGFEVVEEIGVRKMPPVVFVTAFDQHALRAFEVRALDYLLKPFSPARFRDVVERARERLAPAGDPDRAERLGALVGDVAAEKPKTLRRLLVQRDGRAKLLAVGEIDRIDAERNYVRLHAPGGPYLLRGSISGMEERLDPDAFLRVSRGSIVRLDAVAELVPWFHGDYRVVMKDGSTLTWSRRYRAKAGAGLGPGV
jgi:two-component system, LytTR family, response regulator